MEYCLKRCLWIFALSALVFIALYALSSSEGLSLYDYLLTLLPNPSFWAVIFFGIASLLLTATLYFLGGITISIAKIASKRLFLVNGRSGRGSVKIINGEDVR